MDIILKALKNMFLYMCIYYNGCIYTFSFVYIYIFILVYKFFRIYAYIVEYNEMHTH